MPNHNIYQTTQIELAAQESISDSRRRELGPANTMTNNATFTQTYSPCFPQEEQGEWVWVPRRTVATAALPVTPHQSPMYHSFSAEPHAAAPAMPWTPPAASPICSPVGTSAPVAFAPSPIEPLFQGFDSDVDFDTLLEDMDLSLLGQLPDGTAPLAPFPNDLGVDFLAGLDFGFDPLVMNAGILTPPGATSPASPLFNLPPTPATTNPSPSPPTTTAPQLLPCSEPACTKVFPNPSDLRYVFTPLTTLPSQNHQPLTHHRKHARKHRTPFRCPLPHCAKGHLDKRALDRHLWAKHPEHAAAHGTRSEKVRCGVCGYEGRGDNVGRHMKRHAK